MEDTVEHQVEGLAEKIIAEDAERRAQDLVRPHTLVLLRITYPDIPHVDA